MDFRSDIGIYASFYQSCSKFKVFADDNPATAVELGQQKESNNYNAGKRSRVIDAPMPFKVIRRIVLYCAFGRLFVLFFSSKELIVEIACLK